ncbi:MAG: prepilin-type N-terminal cleavage/methylation domain-containing protein [Proteobacteria bacterium]|nr:MAG: prepilin-type N-terminal cleavage/methylation domain-containing protein [Pseudomonadota bacterium]
MKPKSLANQAGFSLVELMTVVAIMGTRHDRRSFFAQFHSSQR